MQCNRSSPRFERGAPNFARALIFFSRNTCRFADFASGGLQRPQTTFPLRDYWGARTSLTSSTPRSTLLRLVYVSLFLHLVFSSLPRRVRPIHRVRQPWLAASANNHHCCRPPGALMGFYRHFDISREMCALSPIHSPFAVPYAVLADKSRIQSIESSRAFPAPYTTLRPFRLFQVILVTAEAIRFVRGAAVVAPPPLRRLTLRPPTQYSPTYDPRRLLYLSGAFPMLPHGRMDGAACAHGHRDDAPPLAGARPTVPPRLRRAAASLRGLPLSIARDGTPGAMSCCWERSRARRSAT